MPTLIRISVALFLIIAILAGVSYLFPSTYRVERAVEVGASAREVFSRVGDLRKWPEWSPWSEHDPRLTTIYSDPSNRKGSTAEWTGPKVGEGKLLVTLHEAPERIVYELSLSRRTGVSTGVISVDALPGRDRVRVVWSDTGKIGINPIERWRGLFLDRTIGDDFEAGLAKLKRISETAAATR